MSSIFPIRETVSLGDREPRLVDLDEETADEVFEALSSGTTREMFLELHHSPQTASDLAEVTDTSVQNAQYHLEKLQEADLVEIVDTWYSERGSEMKVYAPQDESLVLFAGRDKQHSLRRLLNRVMGVLGVLVPGSALVGLGTRWYNANTATSTGGGTESAAAPASGNETQEAENLQTDAEADRTADGGQEATATEDEAVDGADGETGADGEFDAPEMDGQGADGLNNDSFETNETLDAVTDGGTTNEVVDNTTEVADAAAGLDPLLAAALFFFGGLLVFGAFTLYYGDFY